MTRARASIIPIGPPTPLAPERDAGIDVAIDAAAGRGRHALGIGPVRAVARNSPAPALDAIGIIDRGGGRGAGYRGGSARQQDQHRPLLIVHDLVSSASL